MEFQIAAIKAGESTINPVKTFLSNCNNAFYKDSGGACRATASFVAGVAIRAHPPPIRGKLRRDWLTLFPALGTNAMP
jgi:hypothetical protein